MYAYSARSEHLTDPGGKYGEITDGHKDIIIPLRNFNQIHSIISSDIRETISFVDFTTAVVRKTGVINA